MTKLIRWTQNYLLVALPFVMAMMVWNSLSPETTGGRPDSFILHLLRELLSWNLMFWFACLLIFLLVLVVSSSAQESSLVRLAQLKERDEREEYITGQAAKRSFISTMSLLILFLFLSTFTLEVYRVPEAQAIAGKRGTVSIGMHFNVLDSSPVPDPTGEHETLFESRGIPASKAALILLFLVWQLTSFHLAARKETALS